MREKSYLKDAWIGELDDILFELNFMRNVVRKKKKPVKAIALIEGSNMKAANLLVVRELSYGNVLSSMNPYDDISARELGQMLDEIQEEINSRGL